MTFPGFKAYTMLTVKAMHIYILLYYIILYYTNIILYYIVLYYIILYYSIIDRYSILYI